MNVTLSSRTDSRCNLFFTGYLEKVLGWESIYTYNAEIFGPVGTQGRASERDIVLALDLRAAIARLMLSPRDFARDRAKEDGPTGRDLLRRLMTGEIAV